MDGFLVRQPFADLIASGKKTWELRTQPVHLPNKPFYILATAQPHRIAFGYDPSRLGVAVAIAESDGYDGPFTIEELVGQVARHQTPESVLQEYAKGRKLYVMRIVKARRVLPSLRYRAKPGAVTVVSHVEFF